MKNNKFINFDNIIIILFLNLSLINDNILNNILNIS